jgi:hypothetical protein
MWFVLDNRGAEQPYLRSIPGGFRIPLGGAPAMDVMEYHALRGEDSHQTSTEATYLG